jgi:hypothetical protein
MRRSQRTVCIGRSLTQYGLRSLAYAIALSSGKPLEKKEIRKSQTGQFSTSSSRMILSPKMTTSNSPLVRRRFRIFRLGLLRALLSSAQTPITPTEGFRLSSFPLRAADLSLPGLELAAAVLPLILRCVRVRLLDRVTGCGSLGRGIEPAGMRCGVVGEDEGTSVGPFKPLSRTDWPSSSRSPRGHNPSRPL